MNENHILSGALAVPMPASESLVASHRPVGGWVKRVFDCAMATFALVALSPIMLLCAVGARLSTGSSALFGHERVGYKNVRFKCLKFRSMSADADARLAHLLDSDPAAREEWDRSHKLINDPRVTKFGKFLRRSSLDELPQLINVMLGNMSLVGPRPVTDCELRRYGDNVGAYLSARPGITGLWQVSGRSATSYEKRIAFDSAYIESWSMGLDLKILFKTVGVVLRRDGAA